MKILSMKNYKKPTSKPIRGMVTHANLDHPNWKKQNRFSKFLNFFINLSVIGLSPKPNHKRDTTGLEKTNDEHPKAIIFGVVYGIVGAIMFCYVTEITEMIYNYFTK